MGRKNTIEELETILDSIPYEITLKDEKGNYIYTNRRFQKMANHTKAQISGNFYGKFWSEKDYRIIQELDNEVFKKNKGIFFERGLRNADNNERWFHMYKVPIEIDNNKYLFTFSREDTVHKKISNLMEYQLEKDSHDLLGYHDIMYDDSFNRVSDTEFKNRITTLCKNLCNEIEASHINIYLYDEDENNFNIYIGTSKEKISCKQVNLEDKSFFKFVNSKITVDLDMIYGLYKNDRYGLNVKEIRYGNNIIGLMCIYCENNKDNKIEYDDLIRSTCYKFGLLFQNKITANKLREEEKKLAKYKNDLELETMKTEFFEGISHEFRTPLNIITAASQLIAKVLDKCNCDEYKEAIDKNLKYIKRNADRLIRMLNNIFDVNKISMGDNNVSLVNCNIIEVIEDIVLIAADYVKVSGRNIIFDTDVEELIIACDVEKIEKIMLNLISNAIKYSYENTDILINVHYDSQENQIIVSVFDKGVTIDKKDESRAFKKFVQLHRLLNRPCEGSGVGLFLVKSFVELHGGKVWFNYGIKNGAEIDFSIPVNIMENGEVEDYRKAKHRKVEICNVEFSDIYSL